MRDVIRYDIQRGCISIGGAEVGEDRTRACRKKKTGRSKKKTC